MLIHKQRMRVFGGGYPGRRNWVRSGIVMCGDGATEKKFEDERLCVVSVGENLFVVCLVLREPTVLF